MLPPERFYAAGWIAGLFDSGALMPVWGTVARADSQRLWDDWNYAK
jgi:hypothetical protein